MNVLIRIFITLSILGCVQDFAFAAESGPHILSISGGNIPGDIIIPGFGFHVTTTIFSTWIFIVLIALLSGLMYIAIKTEKLPRIRAFGLNAVRRLDVFLTETLGGNKKAARRFLPVVGGFFIFILLANIFGLMIDWISMIFPVLFSYLRPINSDMNTTIVLAVSIIALAQITGILTKGIFGHFGQYFFNYSGNTIIEKIINVPVGWIHFIGEFSRILSLSVRLFANIFAGAALIGVMAYLGTLIPAGPIGGILTLPFWFFEIMVSFIQAFIFTMLSGVYLRESLEVHGH